MIRHTIAKHIKRIQCTVGRDHNDLPWKNERPILVQKANALQADEFFYRIKWLSGKRKYWVYTTCKQALKLFGTVPI